MSRIVTLCTPTLTRPYPQNIDAALASIPLIEAAGWACNAVFEIGCPYISHARATMLRKALDGGTDTIVFIDHDLSWRPEDLLRLIETPGDVVAGMYRYKNEHPHYMGCILEGADNQPQYREDGCVKGHRVPAGFLKITRAGVRKFMRAYPELVYGNPENPAIDLFNHGAHDGVWYGEDMAFSRRWLAMGEDIWIQPDLELVHHTADASFPGHFGNDLTQMLEEERGA